MKKGRGMAGMARSAGLDVRFTPREVRTLAVLAEKEDRSLSGTVHWIVRRFLRGELVTKAPLSRARDPGFVRNSAAQIAAKRGGR